MAYVVYLKNGPCDGQTRTLTANQRASQALTCGGWYYGYSPAAGLHNGEDIYLAISKAPAPGGAVRAAHVHSGWNDLRHSANHVMPASLAASRRNLRAALRTLARARKVSLK